MTISPTSLSSQRVDARRWPALGVLLFGFVLFVAAGFAGPTALHNATHDTRHALGLPCH